MVYQAITHIVLYRPYRSPANSPKCYCLFTDAREALSFEGSHRRVCSSICVCKVDCELTDELLAAIVKGE